LPDAIHNSSFVKDHCFLDVIHSSTFLIMRETKKKRKKKVACIASIFQKQSRRKHCKDTASVAPTNHNASTRHRRACAV
jgi:hypothetical protein